MECKNFQEEQAGIQEDPKGAQTPSVLRPDNLQLKADSAPATEQFKKMFRRNWILVVHIYQRNSKWLFFFSSPPNSNKTAKSLHIQLYNVINQVRKIEVNWEMKIQIEQRRL